MHANESKPITQTDNGVSQCTPSHKRHCISYQPKYHQYHSFIHKFPPEIFRKIIDHAVFEQPCLKHVYNKCFDPWSCKEGSHPDPKLPYVVIPPPYITNQCRIIYKEAYESFYKNSLLIFSTTKDPAAVPHEDGRIDPRATRLLDFTTKPEWKNTGSWCFRRFLSDATYDSIDHYRHNIRHLVFRVDRLGGDNHWKWQFDIDWEGLPRLETLCFDFRAFVTLRHFGLSLRRYLKVYDDILVSGVEKMSCLKLKVLTIVGLYHGCSINGDHKLRMHELFKDALAEGGIIEFLDEEYEW